MFEMTKVRQHLAAPLTVFFVAFFLAACATPKVEPSGFLTTYETLNASDESGAVRLRTSSAEVLASYKSVIIDMPTMVEARLKPAEATAIRASLADALGLELARERVIGTEAAAGTLRVRYAIVRVDTSNVALNALTTTVIGPVAYGSLALEVEVLDSLSGERLAAMTWARGAKAGNVLGAYSPTGNARALAPDFAKRVARLISPDMPA